MPSPGQLDQERADLILRQFVIVGLFADIDALGLPPHQIHHPFVGEPVVEHDIGLLHQAKGAESQEIGIARPRAHQVDLAARRLGVLDRRPFDCAGKLRVGSAIVARKRALSDRSFEDGLPEPAADDRVRESPLRLQDGIRP